jgi:hypothetical protein
MKTVNRGIAVLKAKQPYLDWIESLPEAGSSSNVSLEDLNDDCMTFLVPEYGDNAQVHEFIYKNSKLILEMEFEAWDVRQELWPKNRDRKLFKKMFDVEIHSQVIELMRSPIEVEEY